MRGARVHEALGQTFVECGRMPEAQVAEVEPPQFERDRSLLERWGGLGGAERALEAERLAGLPFPHVEPEAAAAGEDALCRYTWVVEAPEASAVVFWANGRFDRGDPAAHELERLEGSSLWTISLLAPPDWRASFAITPHVGAAEPPWRALGNPRERALAAMRGGVEERSSALTRTTFRGALDVVEGPASEPFDWGRRAAVLAASEPVALPARPDRAPGEAWLHRVGHHEPGVEYPLVVLLDGETLHGEPGDPGPPSFIEQLQAAAEAGELEPVHVLLVPSGTMEQRGVELGVPGGSSALLVGDVIPALQRRPEIAADPRRTVIAGASYGGLSALWAVALAPDVVGHAIVQSPSLWRFDLTGVLARLSRSVFIDLQAGRYEAQIFHAAEHAAEILASSGVPHRFTRVEGGHDWAWWKPGMLSGLARLRRVRAASPGSSSR